MNNLKYSNGSATYVESLEKKIAELEKQIVAIDMNNEPVAWIDKNTGKPRMEGFIQTDHDIPLYTHPAVKELTDEEINWLAKAYSTMKGELNAPAFARAILRKAQEK